MEISRLRPELQKILDQFTIFRNKYSTLKTHYGAQEEIISLQKMELEKMNLRIDKLTASLIDYKKRFNVTLRSVETENQRLRKIVDESRNEENVYIQDIQRNNIEHIRDLEDELEALRSTIDTETKRHKDEIDSLNKRHREEIEMYKKKMEHCNKLEQRQSKEISNYKKILETTNSQQKSVITASKKSFKYSHPALDDDNNNNKRNKTGMFRWPELVFDDKKKMATDEQLTQTIKKKRLYVADNEAIVDLEWCED